MRAGELNRRGTLKSLVLTADEANQPIESYTEFATIWAAIEPLSGREYFLAQQVNSEVSVRIRIRYLAGVVSTMVFVFGSRTFEVLNIIHPETALKELHLMCRERQ